MKPIAMCLSILWLCCSFSSTAETITLNSEETLRVTFNVTPPFDYTPDVIQFQLGEVNIASPLTSLSGSLYNGQTLLGTDTAGIFAQYFGNNTGKLSLYTAAQWKSSASPFIYDNPAIIDFTSILNGTINGRVDFRIQTGSMTINLDEIQLSMIQAKGINWGTESLPAPVITSIDVIPEPATWLLLIFGGMALRKRNLKTRNRTSN
jgi:hypothetical protein